jgi:hypothetical protein
MKRLRYVVEGYPPAACFALVAVVLGAISCGRIYPARRGDDPGSLAPSGHLMEDGGGVVGVLILKMSKPSW